MSYIDSYKNILLKYGSPADAAKAIMDKHKSGDLKCDSVGGSFVSGKFYVFNYMNPILIKEVKNKKKLYHDFNPVVLGLNPSPDADELIGLNLNIMPHVAKLRLFSGIYDIFNNDSSIDKPNLSNISLNISNIDNIPYFKSQIAINKYSKKFISDIKVISLDEFYNLIFLNTKKVLYSRNMSNKFMKKQI